MTNNENNKTAACGSASAPRASASNSYHSVDYYTNKRIDRLSDYLGFERDANDPTGAGADTSRLINSLIERIEALEATVGKDGGR